MAGLRVIVVDDDLLLAKGLAASLAQETGFEAEGYASSSDARSAAVAGRLDAVIAGMRLRTTEGPALLRELRQANPHMVGLLITSPADDEGTARARATVGPLGYVQKPVEMTDLLLKLHAGLDHRRLALELADARSELQAHDRIVRTSEQRIERANAEIESTHHDLTTATERLVQSEQLAAVGRVVSGIAHELDRQLALVGYAEAIKSRVSGDPELSEFADIIINAQKRLAGTVTQMRDFLERQGDPRSAGIEREPTDVAAAIDEAIAFMRYDKDVRQRTICREFRKRPIAALHRQKFSQVIMNLVSNAVLATERDATITVEVDISSDSTCAQIQIVDHGIGMPSEVVARLGQPFFTTRGGRGSGLGVGVCMHLIEEHGGTLTFTSSPGEGTTARVVVPLGLEQGDA